jgi:hypothetical protein
VRSPRRRTAALDDIVNQARPSWVKERTQALTGRLGGAHPYTLWHPRLFETVDAAVVEGCFDQRLILLQLFAGTWERLERTASLWADTEALSAVQISRELSHLYLCLLYPRETLLAELGARLDPGSPEAQLCLFYGVPGSDYRHIRNALAHGTFTHLGPSIEFSDRGWFRTMTSEQLELDCLIILDLFFSAGARVKTVVFDAYGFRRRR